MWVFYTSHVIVSKLFPSLSISKVVQCIVKLYAICIGYAKGHCMVFVQKETVRCYSSANMVQLLRTCKEKLLKMKVCKDE